MPILCRNAFRDFFYIPKACVLGLYLVCSFSGFDHLPFHQHFLVILIHLMLKLFCDFSRQEVRQEQEANCQSKVKKYL